MLLDLTSGVTTTSRYHAWKFPGGELSAKLSYDFMQYLRDNDDDVTISCRLNSSDDIFLLGIILGIFDKDYTNKVHVFIPYFPYQQEDRDFGEGQSFALLTVIRLLNTYKRASYTIYDPHSDVTPALLALNGHVHVRNNHEHAVHVLSHLTDFKNADVMESDEHHWNAHRDLIILSPDAGAYKKVSKLAADIEFKGEVYSASKYRSHGGGDLTVQLPINDFKGKDVLIIDDICLGGRTFIELAKALIKSNVSNLHLMVSHGIFSNGFGDLEHYFQTIHTTNSRADDFSSEAIHVFDIM